MAEIFKHKNLISQRQRREFLNSSGAVVWLTGLSGSGKSTIGALLERTLIESGRNAFLLDGDNLRFGINAGLGFSKEDRSENIRRISHVASLMAQSTCVAIVGAISPFAADRDAARKVCEDADIAFVEVFVDTSLEECARRDVKGLYKKAFSGEISEFTGVSSPYEEPENPEIVIKTAEVSPEKAVEKIIEYIKLVDSLKTVCVRMFNAAVIAGKRILEIYNNGFDVEYKADSSPLTAADLASNDVICKALKEGYPDFALLSEETVDDKSRRENPFCFVVDPLDGTKEFVKRNGEFTVNIALTAYGKSIAGVVYVPVTDEIYYAAKGCGAFVTKGECLPGFLQEERICVSSKTEGLTVMASRSHADEKLLAILEKNKDKIADTVSVGSSLKGCRIAQGRADVYYRTGLTCEWDTAAMQCIVEQAGGVFRQLDSTPMVYNRENTLNEKGFYILNRIENKFDF